MKSSNAVLQLLNWGSLVLPVQHSYLEGKGKSSRFIIFCSKIYLWFLLATSSSPHEERGISGSHAPSPKIHLQRLDREIVKSL